jgi:hypothetical protein
MRLRESQISIPGKAGMFNQGRFSIVKQNLKVTHA